MTTALLHLDICTPEGKTWLALLTGTDRKFGFAREFINSVHRDTSRSGRTGTAEYLLGPGVYESNEGRRRLGRRYWLVGDLSEKAEEISREYAIELLEERTP